METKERNVALAIVFTIITCGIYGIYWFVVLTDEVKQKVEMNKWLVEELPSCYH